MNSDSVREICQKCDMSNCACVGYTWCSFGRDRRKVKGALLGERSNLPYVFGLFWTDFYKRQASHFPCLPINDLRLAEISLL